MTQKMIDWLIDFLNSVIFSCPLLRRGESGINRESIHGNSKPRNIFMACVKCFRERRTNQETTLQVRMLKDCGLKICRYGCRCLRPMVATDKSQSFFFSHRSYAYWRGLTQMKLTSTLFDFIILEGLQLTKCPFELLFFFIDLFFRMG